MREPGNQIRLVLWAAALGVCSLLVGRRLPRFDRDPTVAVMMTVVLAAGIPAVLLLVRGRTEKIFLFLLFLVPFRIKAFPFQGFELDPSAVILGLTSLSLFLRAGARRQVNWPNRWFLAYCAVMVMATIVNSGNPLGGYPRGYIPSILYPFMIWFLCINMPRIPWVLDKLLAVLAVPAVLTILGVWFGGLGGENENRALPTVAGYVQVGAFYGYDLMVVEIVSLAVVSVETRKLTTWLLWFLCAFVFFAILLSGERAPFIAVTLVLMVYLVMAKADKQRRLVSGVVSLVLISAISFFTPRDLRVPLLDKPFNIVTQFTRGAYSENDFGTSLEQSLGIDRRLQYWNVAVEVGQQKPWLGYGIAEYGPIVLASGAWDHTHLRTGLLVTLAEYLGDTVPHPHNMFIWIWITGGIGLLVVFLVMIGGVLWRSLVVYRAVIDVRLKMQVMACMLALAAFMITGMVEIPFFQRGPFVILIWALVGLNDAVWREYTRGKLSVTPNVIGYRVSAI